jgi:predicted P-loop ATPase
MLALAYRQLYPGYQFDYMITLVGQKQGMGKTSFFRTLIAGFDESAVKILKTDFENKDNLKKMSAGAVFVNIDEGAALGKKAQQSIKTFITETEDEYRDPFARELKVHKRRFVFGMTENDMNPFGDATGGRRYWPVEVMTRVNFKWIEENRDQLFAEAWYRARNKEGMIDLPREITDEIQELHRSQDVWEEKVVEFLITQKEFAEGKELYTTKPSQVFVDGFDMNLDKVDQRQERRLTNCMKAIGFIPTTRRVDGKIQRVWELPLHARDRIIRNLSNAELDTLRRSAGTVNQQFENF